MKRLLTILIAILFFACESTEETAETQQLQQETEPKVNTFAPKPASEGNYNLNPYFEQLLSKLQNSPYKINLERPFSEEEIRKKGDLVTLAVKGYLFPEGKSSAFIIVEVYPTSFEGTTGTDPIIQEKISLQQSGSTLLFSYLQSVNLEKGLYYYMLRFSEEEEPIYIGKVKVV